MVPDKFLMFAVVWFGLSHMPYRFNLLGQIAKEINLQNCCAAHDPPFAGPADLSFCDLFILLRILGKTFLTIHATIRFAQPGLSGPSSPPGGSMSRAVRELSELSPCVRQFGNGHARRTRRRPIFIRSNSQSTSGCVYFHRETPHRPYNVK